jgi:hypothetical protein
VSASQAAQDAVNTSVHGSEEVVAHRPFRYGRALVLELPEASASDRASAGLVDIKGAGVGTGVVARIAAHATGVMTLGEALQDWLIQWIVEAIFWHSGSDFAAVPLYAVIDAGFDVRLATGPEPAGLQVRRAHRRSCHRFGSQMPERGSPEEVVAAEIEMLLRCYGVTSSNRGTQVELCRSSDGFTLTCGGQSVADYDSSELEIVWGRLGMADSAQGSCRIDSIDVQLANDACVNPASGQVIDFGTYDIRERFEFGLGLLLTKGRLGGLLRTDDANFQQPIEALRIPGPKVYGADLARRFRRGEINADVLLNNAMAILASIEKKWNVADRFRTDDLERREI